LSFISWNDEEQERMVCLLIPIITDGFSCDSNSELISLLMTVMNVPLNIDLKFPA